MIKSVKHRKVNIRLQLNGCFSRPQENVVLKRNKKKVTFFSHVHFSVATEFAQNTMSLIDSLCCMDKIP